MKDELHMEVELRELGPDPNYPVDPLPLPPVILSSLGNDLAKKTVSTCYRNKNTPPFCY